MSCKLLICLVGLFYGINAVKKPNIVVIIADDMGTYDASFHGSNEIPTPNIDALAYNGVILNSHYTQSLCTPSRASFLTGKYPIHLGMQHLVILEPEPSGLPINETLLPQRLKNNGYKTYAIGKWHLGFYKKEYTPTFRGFDSHYGYWQGYHDYYDHTVHATYSDEDGYDFRRNMSVEYDAKGKYTTTLLTDEAVRTIKNHNTEEPMFMYLAQLAPHAGPDKNLLQAPDEEIAKFAHIRDPERRVYAAMVSMLDKSVGSVITALREKHMLENSIILFMSDNGAQPEGTHANHGSNMPLRGTKFSHWEGGIRNLAAIWSPLIKKPQRVSNELMDISDWLPTLYTAAGLDHSELPKNLDGKDQWRTISEGAKSPRSEVLHQIDEIYGFGGIRQGDWKYVYGLPTGMKETWYTLTSNNSEYTYDESSVLNSPTGTALAGVITYQQIEEKNRNIHRGEERYSVDLLNVDRVRELRDGATIKCKQLGPEEQLEESKCDLRKSPCLFNIKRDPCEQVNLASRMPMIVNTMEQALENYRKSALPPINKPRDPNADPIKWNNIWTNWMDPDAKEQLLQQRIDENIFKLKAATTDALSHLAVGIISGISVGALIVIAILVVLVCRRAPKKSSTSLYRRKFDREMQVKSESPKLFQEKEEQLRASFKGSFREV